MHRPFSFFLFFSALCFSSYGTFPAVFSRLCSLFSFPVCSLGLSLLGFLLFCFCLSVLSVVSGASVLRLPYFPWGVSSPFRVLHLFFGISFIFLFVLPSLLLVFFPPPPAFHWVLWGSILFLGLLILMRFQLWLCFSLPFCICSTFSSCCGSGYSLRSFSAFFRMKWLRLLFSGLPSHFLLLRLRLSLPIFLSCSGCSFRSSSPFSACCSFRFWRASCCLLC